MLRASLGAAWLAWQIGPPAAFEPVGVTFVGGSITSPGMAEANEHNLKKDDPSRPVKFSLRFFKSDRLLGSCGSD